MNIANPPTMEQLEDIIYNLGTQEIEIIMYKVCYNLRKNQAFTTR